MIFLNIQKFHYNFAVISRNLLNEKESESQFPYVWVANNRWMQLTPCRCANYYINNDNCYQNNENNNRLC